MVTFNVYNGNVLGIQENLEYGIRQGGALEVRRDSYYRSNQRTFGPFGRNPDAPRISPPRKNEDTSLSHRLT